MVSCRVMDLCRVMDSYRVMDSCRVMVSCRDTDLFRDTDSTTAISLLEAALGAGDGAGPGGAGGNHSTPAGLIHLDPITNLTVKHTTWTCQVRDIITDYNRVGLMLWAGSPMIQTGIPDSATQSMPCTGTHTCKATPPDMELLPNSRFPSMEWSFEAS